MRTLKDVLDRLGALDGVIERAEGEERARRAQYDARAKRCRALRESLNFLAVEAMTNEESDRSRRMIFVANPDNLSKSYLIEGKDIVEIDPENQMDPAKVAMDRVMAESDSELYGPLVPVWNALTGYLYRIAECVADATFLIDNEQEKIQGLKLTLDTGSIYEATIKGEMARDENSFIAELFPMPQPPPSVKIRAENGEYRELSESEENRFFGEKQAAAIRKSRESFAPRNPAPKPGDPRAEKPPASPSPPPKK